MISFGMKPQPHEPTFQPTCYFCVVAQMLSCLAPMLGLAKARGGMWEICYWEHPTLLGKMVSEMLDCLARA